MDKNSKKSHPFKIRDAKSALDAKTKMKLIENATRIESRVSEIITHYFTAGDTENNLEGYVRFMYCVLEDPNGLSFSGKREILRRILTTDKILSKKQINSIDEKIKYIAAERNLAAHNIDTSWTIDYNPNQIHYKKISIINDEIIQTYEIFDAERLKEHDKITDELLTTFKLLWEIIKGRKK